MLKNGVLKLLFWFKTEEVMIFFSSNTHSSDKHIGYCMKKFYDLKKPTGND